MTRIVFVNRYYQPDESATSQLLTDLATDLARHGHDVTAVTSREQAGEPGARLPARDRRDGVAIRRVWTSRFGRATLPGRALDYMTFHVFAALALARLLRAGDVLVVETDPPLFAVIAGPVARRRGARLVNWLQDLYPETATTLGVLPAGGRLARTLTRWRNRALQAADLNVAIGASMAALVRSAGVSDDRVTVVPNWADGEAISPLAHADNPLRREWFPQDAFVVGYSGNMGRAHPLGGLLDAAGRIAGAAALPGGEPAARICLLFVGGGHQRAGLQAAARGLANVVFRPFQPRARLRQSLGVADLHVVALESGLEGLVVPSKLYGALAAGRPVLFLGAPDGEVARLLEAHDCGTAVAPDDTGLIVRTLLAYASDPERCRREGDNARRLLGKAFTRHNAVTAWIDLLDSLAGGPSGKPAAADRVNARGSHRDETP